MKIIKIIQNDKLFLVKNKNINNILVLHCHINRIDDNAVLMKAQSMKVITANY